jgi:hypothetical protein
VGEKERFFFEFFEDLFVIEAGGILAMSGAPWQSMISSSYVVVMSLTAKLIFGNAEFDVDFPWGCTDDDIAFGFSLISCLSMMLKMMSSFYGEVDVNTFDKVETVRITEEWRCKGRSSIGRTSASALGKQVPDEPFTVPLLRSQNPTNYSRNTCFAWQTVVNY